MGKGDTAIGRAESCMRLGSGRNSLSKDEWGASLNSPPNDHQLTKLVRPLKGEKGNTRTHYQLFGLLKTLIQFSTQFKEVRGEVNV